MPLVDMAKEPERFRVYMKNKGLFGLLIFFLANVLQVVIAIIPGGPFEIAAGYAYGALAGTLLCDAAMTVGSLIAFLLGRKFGRRIMEIFFSREKIESMKFLTTDQRSDKIIFILFLVPGTPKDLISYAVGLTDMSIPLWLFITAVGRFPSILLSALSGSALGAGKYEIFAAVFLLTIVLGAIGNRLYNKWQMKKGG
ncbi:MAG: VTT domain-containing protein [Lachnospiraceae bacterium]|nr:VTT domain-containing protein [Lachnospiraceae bacterium]